jgi:hypothetical protein
MNFLQNLAHAAQQKAQKVYQASSRVVDQVNPLDGGRTYKQRTPTNTAPAAYQAAHNGATNFAGAIVKPAIRSSMALNQGIGNLELKLAGRKTQNTQEYLKGFHNDNINKVVDYKGTKRQIVGDAVSNVANVAMPGTSKLATGAATKVIPRVAPQVIKTLVPKVVGGAAAGAASGAVGNVGGYVASGEPMTFKGAGTTALTGAKYGAAFGGALPVAVPAAKIAGKATAQGAKTFDKTLKTAQSKATTNAAIDSNIAHITKQQQAIQERINKAPLNATRGTESLQQHINILEGQKAQLHANRPQMSPVEKVLAAQPGMSMKAVHSSDLSPEQNQFIEQYAQMKKDLGQGNGVNIMPDGTRTTNNFRTAEQSGKRMTNADWFDHAKQELESGKGAYGASEEYKALAHQKAVDDFIPKLPGEATAPVKSTTPTELQGKTLYRGINQTEWDALQNGQTSRSVNRPDHAFVGSDPELAQMAAEAQAQARRGRNSYIVEYKPGTESKVTHGGSLGHIQNPNNIIEGEYLGKKLGLNDIAKVKDSNGNVVYDATAAPQAKPALVQPKPSLRPQLPASRETGGVSLAKNTPTRAESNFPLRVMTDSRTDPILPTLDRLATHDVKHNAPVLSSTGAKIAQNEDTALAFAKRGSSTEANATAMQLLEKYLSEGSHEKASELLQAVSPRFTRQGQETQILAAYSKTATPAGAVRYATKEVEKASNKSANGAKLEDKTVQIHSAVQQTAKDVAHQLSEEVKTSKIGTGSVLKTAKTPEEMLANRIKAPSDKKFSVQDPVKDMVATLHKVAKQVIPDAEKKLPRDPMQLVGQAIKGKAEYAGVYDKAKALVLDKYKDNPEALAELEKYFGTDASRTYAQSQLKTGMQQGLKGTNLSKIVKEHYSKVNETGQELKQKLIERAGLSESEATQLSGDIQKRYDQLIATKKDLVIKQIFGDKPKPEQVQLADRILQFHNLGAMSRDELRPLVAKKLGLETLSPEASKAISDMAAHIQTLPNGSTQRLQATADMMRFIAEQKPQSRLDNTIGIYKAGMLSGAKTQEGNILSNSIFGGLKKVSDVPASIADRGFALAGKTSLGRRIGMTGDRTIGLTARGGISGTRTGFGKGMSIMKGRPEFTVGDKYEQHAEINLKNPILQKVFGTPSNYVFRGMQAADQPFRYAALKNSLYDQAYAAGRNEGLSGTALKTRAEQLVQNPTEQMAATAARESKKSVLDYDTYASRAIQAAHTGIDRMVENGGSPLGGKIANGALNVLGPFVRVPSAFISRTIDFTPLGIGKEIGHQLFTKTFDQRALSQAIGEGLTGSGIIALGIHLSGQGQLSGDYPKNNQKEQQRWKTEGITPNSIKIGKTWRSLNYFGPIGLLFGVGQKIDEAKGKGNVEKAGQAVAGLGRGLLGQSFLQGLNGFSTAVQDPTKVGSYLNSEVSSIIPSWINDIGNATDKLQRQADNVGEAVKGRLPGVRHGLNPKQDVYGNSLPNQAYGLNAINGLKPSNDLTTNNPVTSEVSRLHSVDPNNNDLQVTPTPITSVTIPGANKGDKSTVLKLNDKQKYAIQKQVGQAIQTNWGKLIGTSEYQALSDEAKAKALSNLRTDTTALATRQYVIDNNLGTYSKGPTKSVTGLGDGSKSVTDYTKTKSSSTTPPMPKNPHPMPKTIITTYDEKTKTWTEKSTKTGRTTVIAADGTRTLVDPGTRSTGSTSSTRRSTGTSTAKSSGSTSKRTGTPGYSSRGAFKAYKSNLGSTIAAARKSSTNSQKYQVAKISLSSKIKGATMQKYTQPKLRKRVA